jgi:hypothetical protein
VGARVGAGVTVGIAVEVGSGNDVRVGIVVARGAAVAALGATSPRGAPDSAAWSWLLSRLAFADAHPVKITAEIRSTVVKRRKDRVFIVLSRYLLVMLLIQPLNCTVSGAQK